MADSQSDMGEKNSKKAQAVMPKHTSEAIRYWIYALTLLMVFGLFFVDRFKNDDKEAWISISSSISVGLIYVLVIYFRYGNSPEKQKHLKAVLDVIANSFSLFTLFAAYVYIKFFGKAENIFDMLANSKGGNVLVGVFIGILAARVIFPLWDLYSKYRKV